MKLVKHYHAAELGYINNETDLREKRGFSTVVLA